MQLYLLKQGDVRGPFEETEVREMLATREATPDTPACKTGEESWSTLASCLGIKVPPKLDVPSTPSSQNVEDEGDYYSAYKTRHSLGRKVEVSPKYIGIERGLFLTQYAVQVVLSFFLDPHRSAPEAYLSIGLGLVALWATILRLRNVGKNSLWGLLLLVPFANLYVAYLCVVTPPNYAKTRQLDALGNRLRIVYYILCLPWFLLAGFVILFALGGLLVRLLAAA